MVNGSIHGREHVEPSLNFQDVIAMVETSDGRRLLAFFNQLGSVAIVDASNVTQPVVLGTVSVPFNQSKALSLLGVAFSADGRYLFASNGYADLSAIDVTARSVVGSLGGDYRYGTIEASQGISGTQLAVYGGDATTTGISLIDASDPAHLAVVQRHTPPGFSYKSGIRFSKDGRSLYVATNTAMVGLDLPTLQESFVVPVPGALRQAQQILPPAF